VSYTCIRNNANYGRRNKKYKKQRIILSLWKGALAKLKAQCQGIRLTTEIRTSAEETIFDAQLIWIK
jgi:hypothetical protein